jgi:hypothetical protein
MLTDIINKPKLLAGLLLILVGTAGRFVLVEYVGIPNLEVITALALISGIYLSGAYAVVVPLSIIFLSDLVIGSNYIFIFTWTAFAMIGLLGVVYKKLRTTNCELRITKNNLVKRLFEIMGLGIGSSIFFYLYTNFGWWLVSGMYEHSLSGLLRCYWMAVPFFRNNLLGNLIFVPLVVYVASRVFYGANRKILICNKLQTKQTKV